MPHQTRLQVTTRYATAAALAISLCAWFAYVAFRPALPTSLIVAAALLTVAGMALLAFWSWSARQHMQEGVEQLIGAAERLSRSEFSQPVAGSLAGHLGLLQRAFERMRVALHDTTYSRDYLHSVLNSMSDSVFVAAPDGAIRIVNDAAQRLTGYGPEELSGMNIASLLATPVEEGVDPLAVAREHGETVLRTRAGQTIPVSFVVSTVATAAEEFAGDIYVARDITERKRAERHHTARYDPTKIQTHAVPASAGRLARARRFRAGAKLPRIDMDRFKVNDTFSHASGDMLELLTERLTRAQQRGCRAACR
jgi:PAS domain S-box-containing protein